MTRFKSGGFRAVADYGRPGGRPVRTPELDRRLAELFAQGLGPRRTHRAVAKLAGYGTVQALHAQWLADRATRRVSEVIAEPQKALPLEAANEIGTTGAASTADAASAPSVAKDTPGTAEGATIAEPVEPPSSAEQERRELSLEEVASAQGIVQHVGSWMLLGLLNALGVYEVAEGCRGDAVSMPSLRLAMDATAIALAIGEECVEGVRRIETPSAGTLLRHAGGVSASWTRRILHAFADQGSTMFQATMASRLLARTADGDGCVVLYIDNHLRPYTGKHVIRKGWRMQAKRAVPGTTDYYVHDETGSPLWRMSTTSHDSLCAWLMPAVEFARLSLGEHVTPVLVFDRGGAFPEMMAELRDAGAEFVTYERKPYPELPATVFDRSLSIEVASRPSQPIVIRYTEAPQKNLRAERGRVRRIALLTDDGRQVNLVAVSSQSAEVLIRWQLARWGLQENQLKHEVERWGINHLDGRKVEPYPADTIIPNPERRRLERVLKLSHTAEGEAWRKLVRLEQDDPRRQQIEKEIHVAMDRQREIMALRAKVPKAAKLSDTPLAGKLQRHVLTYKNTLDTLRVALANAESDLAVLLASHLDRPREAKKTLPNLFAAPGTVHLAARTATVRLMPAATTPERAAIGAFLQDLSRLNLNLPGDPDRRHLRWMLK